MFEVSFPAMVMTIVVFLALIYFLNQKLYKPLLAFMEERENSIKKDEELANQNTLDLNIDKAELEKAMSEANMSASQIKNEAIQKAKDKVDEILSKKRVELQADFDDFMNDLAKQKDEIKAGLQSKIPEFQNSLKATLSKI
ncbi:MULTISPECIES: F0F1 ATP synthase subunit B' [Campylobacter]|uniref:F0F1 ATP synthase subunit B family protein n=1 Tax=Campylobacter TaxID=194 RepID=UPI0023F06FD1|nr:MULTISPECIES: F0F1 ATP synthase subunit B' [Campylobacter]MCI6642242.1 F0F1 ATP synthase subunit B' [Campylobacter sp.]MDD7422117.1 F0F1 ATP synthase subunit B' [Campylobacter hominis]MDY3117577.1 F0F1 ATP synthase subunit B' [Campylobacter hominis]